MNMNTYRVLKLAYLAVAGAAAYAAHYFNTDWPLIITAYLLWQYFQSRMSELVILGTFNAITAYEAQCQAVIEEAEAVVNEPRERRVLDKKLFASRLIDGGE